MRESEKMAEFVEFRPRRKIFGHDGIGMVSHSLIDLSEQTQPSFAPPQLTSNPDLLHGLNFGVEPTNSDLLLGLDLNDYGFAFESGLHDHNDFDHLITLDKKDDHPGEPVTFLRFPDLEKKLRLQILCAAALNYEGRFIEPYNFELDLSQVLFHGTNNIQSYSKHLILPFPLCNVSREARAAVRSVSTCHIWVREAKFSFDGFYQLHFRPVDKLYLRSFAFATQRIADSTHILHGFHFCNDIKSLTIHPAEVSNAQRDPAAFIRAIHAFPQLEEINILQEYFPIGFKFHGRLGCGPWAHHPFGEDRNLQDMLGSISLEELRQRPFSKAPLKISEKCPSPNDYFDDEEPGYREDLKL